MSSPAINVEVQERQPLDSFRSRLMFWLSIVFLLVLAGILHRHKIPDPEELRTELERLETDVASWVELQHPELHSTELQIELSILLVLWPIFLVESLIRFLRHLGHVPFFRSLLEMLLIWICPPFRMGAASRAHGEQMWLPGWGWRVIDKKFNQQLESAFGVPMVIMALMVLPLLAAEYFFRNQIAEYRALRNTIEWCNAIIWFSFAVEFVIMVSAAPKWLTYCFRHWVDLAIICLPFLSFMPLARLLRVTRVLRLSQLTRFGRLYRLQGLAFKGWRALMLLQIVQRLAGTTLEKRLARLEELEQAKLEELDDLREEMDEIRKAIAERDAEALAEGLAQAEPLTTDNVEESPLPPHN